MKYIILISLFTIGSYTCKGNPSATQDSLTLYIFLSDECVITQYYIPTINALYEQYGREIAFIAVFPNFSSKRDKIKAFYEMYGLKIPFKTDYYKHLCRKLGATITPEAILYNESNSEILYQGRIDNSYASIGKRRRVITSKDLEEVLALTKSKVDFKTIRNEAIGCFINFNDKISNQH